MNVIKIKGKIYKVEDKYGNINYTFLASWLNKYNGVRITFIPIKDFRVIPTQTDNKAWCRKEYKYMSDSPCSVNDILKIKLKKEYKIEL